MRIDRYIAVSRVIDIESTDFVGAITELLEVCEFPKIRDFRGRSSSVIYLSGSGR